MQKNRLRKRMVLKKVLNSPLFKIKSITNTRILICMINRPFGLSILWKETYVPKDHAQAIKRWIELTHRTFDCINWIEEINEKTYMIEKTESLCLNTTCETTWIFWGNLSKIQKHDCGYPNNKCDNFV